MSLSWTNIFPRVIILDQYVIIPHCGHCSVCFRSDDDIPFTMGLATESLMGNPDTGSCAMFDVAYTYDSSDHPGFTQADDEFSDCPFSTRANTLGVRVPRDRRNRLGAPGDRCLSSSLPCSHGMTSSIKTKSRVCLIPLVRKT